MAAPFHKPVVCPVLIDRISDLATLHALIDQAKSGRGQALKTARESGQRSAENMDRRTRGVFVL